MELVLLSLCSESSHAAPPPTEMLLIVLVHRFVKSIMGQRIVCEALHSGPQRALRRTGLDWRDDV